MAVYEAPPTLAHFLESDAFFRVVKGPFGSGKSSACVIELARRARMQAPGPDGVRRTRFAVVRNTYRELEDTTRKTFEAWIPPNYGAWQEEDFSFVLRAKGCESEIMFRALDKPKDVKKLLSLELTGAYLNELREIPKLIVDGLTGRIGRYPAKKDGGATWKGIWADTNPWHTGHWGYKMFAKAEGAAAKIPMLGMARPGTRLRYELTHPVHGKIQTHYELYVQPGGLDADAENTRYLDADYYPGLCAGKDQEWIDVYVHGKDAQSDKGSIFGPLIDVLDKEGRICEFETPTDGVFTFWDLGIGDACSIWFWRLANGSVDFIDHYENSGEALSHYCDVIDKKGYQIVKHWLPHDARNRSFVTGASVQQQCQERFGADKVAIGPQLSLLDGIAAARWLLEQKPRFHTRCDDRGDRDYSGLDSLREYRYEWDADSKTFSRVPRHDFASHAADAFRGTACVVQKSRLLTEKRPPAAPVIVDPSLPKLDDLWRDHAKGRRRERVG